MTTAGRSSQLVGALVLGALVLVSVLVFTGKLSLQTLQGGDTREVTASFDRAGQLRSGIVVYVDGVRAGKITDVSRPADGRAAKATMEVEREAGPLYADARAALRWKTVLGGAFYVDLDRGRPSTGQLAGTIPASRTSTQVELDELLAFDQGAGRRGLQRMPRALADALSDDAAFRGALDRVGDVAPSLADGLEGLRGARDGDLEALVEQTAATVRSLDTPTGKARDLIQGAALTLETTGQRTADIRRALQVAPGALTQTRRTLPRLEATLRLLEPVARDLATAAPDVAPTLSQLRPTLTGADRLLRRAEPLLADLRPALRSLGRTSDQVRNLLVDLRPGLDDLDERVLPYLNEKDPVTGRTTAQMIGPTFTALGPGMSGQEDQNGHFVRFPATVGSSPFYLPCQTYLNNPDKEAIVQCQALSKTFDQIFTDPGRRRR